MNNNIIEGMPDEEYRKAPGINNSSLKWMRKSPAHYIASLESKAKYDSQALAFGRIVHGYILENKLFSVKPEGLKYSTKEGRAWRDEQVLPVVTQDEADSITGIAQAVLAHPIGKLIRSIDAKRELSVFSKDVKTGLLLKGRIDCAIMGGDKTDKIIDIKTTDDASASSFAKSCVQYGYARQAAFYGKLTGCWDFTFLAVEKEAPYACQAFKISTGSLQTAIQQIRLDLDTVAECMARNEWPSYTTDTTELELYV